MLHQSETKDLLTASHQHAREPLVTLRYSRISLSARGWFQSIDLVLRPLLSLKSVAFCRNCNWESICRNTMLIYLQKMTKWIEENIESILAI